MLPNIAGIIRLMNHRPTVADNIPIALALKVANKYNPTCPLMPSSARAMEGTTAIVQKNNAERKNPSTGGTITFIHLSKTKYCTVKTAKRSIDMKRIVNCSFAVKRISSWPYILYFCNHFILLNKGNQLSNRQ